MGERVVRISAADIGMHTGEPDLRDPLRIGAPGAGSDGFRALIPQQRMECGALIVEREGVAGLRTRGLSCRSGSSSGQRYRLTPRVISSMGRP